MQCSLVQEGNPYLQTKNKISGHCGFSWYSDRKMQIVIHFSFYHLQGKQNDQQSDFFSSKNQAKMTLPSTTTTAQA